MPPRVKKGEPPIRAPLTIATELGEVYYIRKDAEDEQGKLRNEFFTAAMVAQTTEGLAQKTLVAPEGVESEEAATAHATLYNPGWSVVEVGQSEKGNFAVMLREDPDYLPYSVVVQVPGGVIDSKGNEHPGYVITKSIVSGSMLLDDERLSADDPDLYMEVTVIDNYEWLSDLLYHAGVDFDEIDARLAASNAKRVPKNPDDLDAEQREAIKPYLYEGKKTKKLLVRFAKDDEIGEG